jgi:1,4-alpha-glucan branching enzyme
MKAELTRTDDRLRETPSVGTPRVRLSTGATVIKSATATSSGALTLAHCDEDTAMGATLLPNGAGATFRVWAPAAREVRLRWQYRPTSGEWRHQHEAALQNTTNGFWAGFLPDVQAGERYLFYVVGPEGGGEGLKRDPYARELTEDPAWPACQCVLIDPAAFPWHDAGFRPAAFRDLMIYQLHVGVWSVPAGRPHGTFLDVAEKLPYLEALGVNAIQPLPIVEFPTMFSLGYNGVDYFAPETDYAVRDDDPALEGYRQRLNALLIAMRPGARPYTRKDFSGTANQMKVMVDLCHVFGIAVVLDVVYNHAGGDFGDRSLYFFDERARGNQNDSLYFTDHGWAGGLVFAYWNDHVRQFLIDNARYHLLENHCDGFRYDEVSVIKNEGGAFGWRFCQDITDTCRYLKPDAIGIAESWPVEPATVAATAQGGAGFDATLNDGLREAIRSAIGQASAGASAFVDLDRIAREIASPVLAESWRAVQCTENHDLVRQGRAPRVPVLADSADPRSWYARSRSRVALGLTLTSAGIPHVFMGQELLEAKPWSDDPKAPRIDWRDAEKDRTTTDFLRFARELIALRGDLKGLRGDGLNVFHVHNDNRVLAFHRWVPGEGRDVVIVASLHETTWENYELGFPRAGRWLEVFNSDLYDNYPNPTPKGNEGGVLAVGPPRHGLPYSTTLTIPANSLLIFAP